MRIQEIPCCKLWEALCCLAIKSAISGSLSCQGGTGTNAPWLILTSWSRVSKLAAGMMARLVLALVLVVDKLVVLVDAGTHLDEPWFRWKDGVVPFYFQARRHSMLQLGVSTSWQTTYKYWGLIATRYEYCGKVLRSGHARGRPGVCAQSDGENRGGDMFEIHREKR